MPRPNHGAFIQAVVGADADRLPHWQQVYRAVRHAIDSGTLAAGARLPSARQLARDWQVSRGAVDEAFDQLQAEGRLQRRVGDGSYVGGPLPPPPQPSPAPKAARPAAARRQAPHRESAWVARPLPPLHPRATAIDAFPLERWRRLMLQAHAEGQRDALVDAAPRGLPELRAAVARHVCRQRGLDCTADQVFVVDSPARGIALVARVLLEPGDAVWVEDPGHPSMPSLLESLGARVCGVPLDDQGFDLGSALALEPAARLAYLHPLAQYPLAQRTSPARACALLDWAVRCRGWVVEGSFNDELVRAPEPALMARSRDDRVLLLGTFEGVMFPSLRVAYLIVPSSLVPAFDRVRAVQGHHTARGAQWALARFIDGGHLEAHLRELRARLSRQRVLLREALSWLLPPAVRVGPLDGAGHFCLHLPRALRDQDLAAQLARQGIVVEPLSGLAWRAGSPAGRVGAGAPGRSAAGAAAEAADRLNGLVVGHAGWDLQTLEAGLRLIGATLAAALQAQATGPRRQAAYQPSGENT
jgi:GntR family transcriptional regulator/MocR family aminotransferase